MTAGPAGKGFYISQKILPPSVPAGNSEAIGVGFDLAKCDFSRCRGECLTECPYIDFDETQAKQEIAALMRGEEGPILTLCITCGACNEFCPTGANPWDLISWRQEEREEDGNPAGADRPIAPYTEVRGPPGGPLITLGGTDEVMPRKEFLSGALFEDATIIGGGDFCCGFTGNRPWHASRPIRFLPDFLANLARAAERFGTDEIVFTHDACYNVATTFAAQQRIEVPFHPVHILEYLRNWLRDHPGAAAPLAMDVAVQGGCTTHYAPRRGDGETWSDWMEQIFALIGVRSVELARKYTGRHRLCCGATILHSQHERAMEIQKRNIQDAIDAGAEACIFLCPACLAAMRRMCGEMGLEPIYITRLVGMALGEDPATAEFDTPPGAGAP
jgi:Fe-S oxidoreductase